MSRTANRRSGYSLMEMSIVLTVLAVIATSVLGVYQTSDNDEKIRLTKARMDRIERAFADYYHLHHRLPCPAKPTVLDGNQYFAMETKYEGNCTDITPALPTATASPSEGNVVSGIVPVRTLELPDDVMYDAWNRRITYVVDQRATKLNALLENDANTATLGNIRVNDANGEARTNAAVYVLISHGINGHGAYLSSGSVMDAGSTNTDEAENADGDGIAVMKNATLDPTSSATRLNAFDDIVIFKERWSLLTGADRQEVRNSTSATCGPDGPGYTGPSLLVSMNTDADGYVIKGYNSFANNNFGQYGAAIFTPGDEPDTTRKVTFLKLSSDNKMLLIGFDSAPYFEAFYWTSFTGFKKMTEPATMPSAALVDGDWSYDDGYVAVGGSGGLSIYKFDESTCSLTFQDPMSGVGPDVSPITNVASVAWHPSESNYLAVGGNVVGLAVYKQNGDVFNNMFNADAQTICTYMNNAWVAPAAVNCNTGGSGGSGSGRLPGTATDGDTVKQVTWTPDGNNLLVSSGNLHATHLIYGFTPDVTLSPTVHHLTENYRFTVKNGVTENGGLAAAFTTDSSYSGTYLFTSHALNTMMYKYNSGTGRYTWTFTSTIPGSYSNAANCGVANLTGFDISADNYIAFASTTLTDLVVAQITDMATGAYTCMIQDDGYTPANEFKVEFAH